jgi:hypothetical protein
MKFNPVKFNHIIDSETKKRFCTVCTIELPNATLIGVSLCSDRDQFSRKIGRELSAKRARIAMMSLRNTLPLLCFYRESNRQLSRNLQAETLIPCLYKSIYIPKEQS